MSFTVNDRNGVVEFDVLVQPRASREGVAGVVGDRLKIRLTAPPVDGEANSALVAFVARVLALPRSHVVIVRGETGRRKTLRVVGAAADAVRRLGEPS